MKTIHQISEAARSLTAGQAVPIKGLGGAVDGETVPVVATIKAETPKAILIETPKGTTWVPKSLVTRILKRSNGYTLYIADWAARIRNL